MSAVKVRQGNYLPEQSQELFEDKQRRRATVEGEPVK